MATRTAHHRPARDHSVQSYRTVIAGRERADQRFEFTLSGTYSLVSFRRQTTVSLLQDLCDLRPDANQALDRWVGSYGRVILSGMFGGHEARMAMLGMVSSHVVARDAT